MMRHADAAGTAADVVLASLADASARLDGLAPAVAVDDPDAVHQARVLVRRLRSVLAAARALFDAAEVDRARDELEVLGDELGRIRDLEVRIAQAEANLDADATNTMRRRLVEDVRARHRAAHADFVARLDLRAPLSSPIHSFLDLPSRTLVPGEPDSSAARLVDLLDGEVHRVLRADARAGGDLTSLHRLRRAARRLRYVAEAVADDLEPALGDRVRGLAAAAEAVQDLLGANRDGRLFAAELDALAHEHCGDGDPASVTGYRMLAATVRDEAAARLRDLPEAMGELRRRARTVVGSRDD